MKKVGTTRIARRIRGLNRRAKFVLIILVSVVAAVGVFFAVEPALAFLTGGGNSSKSVVMSGNLGYIVIGKSDASNKDIIVELDSDIPSVTTNDATSVGTETATLQGDLVGLGTYGSVNVYFEYGTTTGYGTETTQVAQTVVGAFNQSVSGLTSNTLYHYRAKVSYGAGSIVNGGDKTFTTESTSENPAAPTNFIVASATATSLTLEWTKGGGATNTVIRSSLVGYPTAVTEGDAVYNGVAETTTPAGLTTGTRYYFSAWSETGGLYSLSYATTSGIPTADELPVPDTLEIETVQIYHSYIEDNDQILVFSTKILWDEGIPATLNPADFFYIQVLDDGVLLKQNRIVMWGYVPGSIYISAATALTWNEDYTFRIIGTDKFGAPPSVSYTLGAANYIGGDYNFLATWVLDLATRMQDSVYWGELIEFQFSQKILNAQGSLIFSTAIPGLADVAPQVFYPEGASAEYVKPTAPKDEETRLLEGQEDAHGEIFWPAITAVGTMFGVDDQFAVGAIWMLLYFVGVYLIVRVGGNPGQAIVFAYPIMLVGGQFGAFSLSFLAAIGIGFLFFFVLKRIIFTAG